MPPDCGLTTKQMSGIKGDKKQLTFAFTIDATAEIYDLNILKALQMADTAWKEVDTTTIWNCWNKTGILPDKLIKPSAANGPASAPSVPVSSLLNAKPADAINAADVEVQKALSYLEQHGVLQHKNWMDIDELFNPINENKMYADGIAEEEIEKDIFLAVVEGQKGEQNQEEKSSDAVDDSEVISVKPSHQEALNVASTILRYVSDMDQQYACQLEGILVSFGCQTHLEEFQSLQPTTLNEYFTKNLNSH
ncbi:hypothetical protein C0989_005807, partial [Termitomyces sp. Mn162]